MAEKHLLKEKHDHGPLIFPKGFLWGTATSAYQVEGNNINSDWWDWEVKNQPRQLRSGVACDQYNLYAQDFKIAKDLNLNAHRFSVEWARIEPKKGEFDEVEVKHYLKVLESLKKQNLKVMLTLWHFTLPKWVAEEGGFENSQIIGRFANFTKFLIPKIKDYVDFWVTLNEPSVYTYMAYLSGVWPPQKKSKLKSFFVLWNLAQAHKEAYNIIHKIVKKAKVGIAHNVQSFDAYHRHSISEEIAVGLGDAFTNHFFYLLTQKKHDFLGINYYFHHRFRKLNSAIPEIINNKDQYRDVSDLGWEVYPEGIFDVLSDLANHIPIYITECGIASTNDDRRTRFLIQYLQEIFRGIKANIPIKGFFYWSLIDNFEWHQGFEPRFGLVEIDYQTQKRTPRPSAYVYQRIANTNGIPHELLRLLGHTVRVEEVLCYLHKGPKALCQHIINSRYPKFSKPIDLHQKD